MKKLILVLLILSLSLWAQQMTFSGIKGNLVHELSAVIIKKAYANIGIDAKFMFLPGERALKHSNDGLTDGEISRIKRVSQKYRNLLLIPVEINSVEAAVFTRNDSIVIEKWSDLKPYKVVIVKGTKFIEKGTKNMNPFVVSKFKIAFDMLLAKRADIVVVPKITGDTFTKKARYKRITRLDVSLKRLALHHFIHKKNRTLLEKITQSLQKMSDSGELEKIRNNFISSH